jgi:hypothetical protein
MNDKIIFEDDQESATYRTDISGWVDANGLYFGDKERTARYSGSTHRRCEKCGHVFKKNAYCRPCREEIKKAQFLAMPKKKWDGSGCVYSLTDDKYFWSMDEVDDFCYNEGLDDDLGVIHREKLELVICEPIYAREIPEDFYYDDLPEDSSLEEASPELFQIVNNFNHVIHEERIILSWQPGKFAVECE